MLHTAELSISGLLYGKLREGPESRCKRTRPGYSQCTPAVVPRKKLEDIVSEPRQASVVCRVQVALDPACAVHWGRGLFLEKKPPPRPVAENTGAYAWIFGSFFQSNGQIIRAGCGDRLARWISPRQRLRRCAATADSTQHQP